MNYELIHADCREVMGKMAEASVDAIVTDPPYGLEFMGKGWDRGVPGLEFWGAALRVLKPGAHLVAFGGTRTYHRLACAIEDAGFEVRDCLMWLYGTGFPKSLNVGKAIDKAAGKLKTQAHGFNSAGGKENYSPQDKSFRSDYGYTHEHTTDAAKQWDGWGTALKPAWEPIILARKPLAGTVAANVQEHGTGAVNVDGCRISVSDDDATAMQRANTPGSGRMKAGGSPIGTFVRSTPTGAMDTTAGRWPANVVLDEDAAAQLDAQSGERPGMPRTTQRRGESPKGYGIGIAPDDAAMSPGFGDSGGASRFFYIAKASSGERHYAGKNTHPTVKPVDLMRWLCRLVTPPKGLILDPFMGSGSTGVAALAEGFRFVGIELDSESVDMARRRIAGPLFAGGGKG